MVCGPYLVTQDTGGRGTRHNPQYLALTRIDRGTNDGTDWFVNVLQNSRKNSNRYANGGTVLSLAKGRIVEPGANGNTVHACRNLRDGEVTIAVTAPQADATRTAPSSATPSGAANPYGPGGMAEPAEMSEFPVDAPGRALGGRMRAQPGTHGAQVASLPEGTPVTITHGTPQWMNGYLWYGVEASGRRGYVWGGILCAPGRDLPGLFRCQ